MHSKRKRQSREVQKICFAASSGGHFEQLMRLKPLMENKEFNSFILTEKTKYKINANGVKTYFVNQVNRKDKCLAISLIKVVFQSSIVYLKERPDIVITTGVMAMIPICLMVKLFGGRLIYIESFAKISSPTKTGKFLYRFSDRFYVQWPGMMKYYPNSIYIGGIY